jgi:DNA polymerase IV
MGSSVATVRCTSCGSPRSIDLEAAAGLDIAHVDCDAFYASIEKRDNPDLKDKPVIVGGTGPRSVAATCCYIARTFGVRSAMPMGRARSLCPDAVVLTPDMAKYARVGREIRARMFEITPLLEPLSIDEVFLDLTSCEGVNGTSAAETLARFAPRVEAEIGVTVSVGLSYCKFLAKFASELDKPRGFAVRRRKPGSLRKSSGDCGASAKRGRAVSRVSAFAGSSDLLQIDEWEAVSRLGEDGRRLWGLARGSMIVR